MGVWTISRILRHLWCEDWTLRRAFPKAVLRRIADTVARQEQRHSAELRFAVEGGLPPWTVVTKLDARARAVEVFSALRVWDTECNNGVLIYVLLADRRVEILADRGINAKVGATAWEAICGEMQRCFERGAYEEGAVIGLESVSDLLALHFPDGNDSPNELQDEPVVL